MINTEYEEVKILPELIVQSKFSSHVLKAKIVKKPTAEKEDLLITKVFCKDGSQLETTKLGRLDERSADFVLSSILSYKEFMKSKYIHE